VTYQQLLDAVAALRRARIAGRPAPHKPLLLLWLLARYAGNGSTAVTYAEAEEPVSRLINDFGPVVSGPSRARERAAMPFVHLERELWEVRDGSGTLLGTDVPERGSCLRELGAHGRLRPGVEELLAVPEHFDGLVRHLLGVHFEDGDHAALRAAVGLGNSVEDSVLALARRVAGVEGVVGVCLGGSRARGAHRPDSDWDLGLYYRRPLDTGALRRLAAGATGREVAVSEPGEWGPWVDGGAWLELEGTPVDWIYRDVDRVRRIWADCREGRFEWGAQTGHPLGVCSPSYVGELVLGRVLADPGGELTALREEARSYPPALREALVGQAAFEAPFLLRNARKGAAGGDAAYVAGCLFRAVGLLVQALHAHAGTWVLNEKGGVEAAGRLPCAPDGFAARAHALCGGVGTSPVALAAVLDAGDRLTEEVLALVHRDE
jgi:predicted nucleotidyltransferase